jgi:hypothetical protein
MSALGQKPTLGQVRARSVLPPIADIRWRLAGRPWTEWPVFWNDLAYGWWVGNCLKGGYRRRYYRSLVFSTFYQATKLPIDFATLLLFQAPDIRAACLEQYLAVEALILKLVLGSTRWCAA